MKKLFFILVLCFGFMDSMHAQWCGCPCLRNRYANPWWVNDNSWFYGYFDINEYPYTLPVNIYFNPRPCPNTRCFSNYNYIQRRVDETSHCKYKYSCPRN